MPEGHTLHRLARDLNREFAGAPVRASSPQGRFAAGAAQLDGRVIEKADAYGKHLLVRFEGDRHLHVHLGLYGSFVVGDGEVPPPRGQIRLRVEGDTGFADLRGATCCELITRRERAAVIARLGPDPLRRGARGELAFERIARSRQTIGALLMHQDVLAGVGIDTTRRAHTPGSMKRAPRKDRHGGDVYVYRRAGDRCYVCGDEICVTTVEARNLFWCPICQPRGTVSPAH